MIDFHNHILPNIDDGSKSLKMSLSMLKNASEQGITDVVNTVHYQHPKVDGVDISYETILKKRDELQSELENKSINIKIHIGAEVYFFPNLTKIVDDKLSTIGKGKFMLIEFSPNLIPVTHKKTLFDLKMSGVTPIIAHPERYKPVQKDIGLVYNWLLAGCLIQIDAGSILGKFGKSAKSTSKMIIKNKWCQIMGSDAHDNKKRNFILRDSLKEAKNLIGKDAESLVNQNPYDVLNGNEISVEIDSVYSYKEKHNMWDKFVNKLF